MRHPAASFIQNNKENKVVFTPRLYMTGKIKANLRVATTGTDADWIVKVIDVYLYPVFTYKPVKAGHFLYRIRKNGIIPYSYIVLLAVWMKASTPTIPTNTVIHNLIR